MLTFAAAVFSDQNHTLTRGVVDDRLQLARLWVWCRRALRKPGFASATNLLQWRWSRALRRRLWPTRAFAPRSYIGLGSATLLYSGVSHRNRRLSQIRIYSKKAPHRTFGGGF